MNHKLVRLKIRVTRVINISGHRSVERRINNRYFVFQSKQIAITNAELSVVLFAFITNWDADLLTNIFDDDVFSLKWLSCEKTVPMDFTLPNLNSFRSVSCCSVLLPLILALVSFDTDISVLFFWLV